MGILSAIPVIGRVVEAGLGIVDQWVEDKDKANQLKAEIRQQIESQDHEQIMAQLEGQLSINRTEAKHKSIFVAGWRPFIGWVGGVALAYQFVAYPLLLWGWAWLKAEGIVPEGLEHPPVLEFGPLFALVSGMLGIGGMRSFDKLRGKQTDRLK